MHRHEFSYSLRQEWSWVFSGMRQPRYLLSSWYFYVLLFRVISSLSWDAIFKYFLSSSLVRCRPLLVSPSIYKFPFLQTFWFIFDLVVLFLPLLIISMAQFFMLNSIKISSVTIITTCIRVLGKQFAVVHVL